MLLEHNGADAKVLPPSIAVGKKAMSKKISGLKHQRSHSADRLITSADHHPSSSSSTPSQSVELLHINEVCVRVCVRVYTAGAGNNPADPAT